MVEFVGIVILGIIGMIGIFYWIDKRKKQSH